MVHRGDEIREVLAAHPRVGLLRSPTPIHDLPRLSEALGRTLFAMRDDLTGFALGGNKIRKLDFLIADALARGVDTFVVPSSSSFSRNAAAAGRAHGIEVHVVVPKSVAEPNPASDVFLRRVGAEVHPVPELGPGGAPARELERVLEELVASLRAKGRHVQQLHPGGSDRIGTLGYVAAAAEICDWSDRHGVELEAIFHATGSAATQAGLVLGLSLAGHPARVIGVAVSQRSEAQRARVMHLVRTTAEMLGVEDASAAVRVDDRALGAGYPIPSDASNAATDLFLRTEGLLLDPVYAGKAAAALIAHAQSGELAPGERALFIHTGGNGGVYY